MSSSAAISAVIITRNAGGHLGACLDSLAFADEILVVDSDSTDNTVALAQAAGARVVQQAWLGFGPQKQFAVGAARHDWVLCIDADERISPRLAHSIQQQLQDIHQPPRSYSMARCNRFLGHWLRHGEGYPDWSLRLFHRKHANWSDDLVHETVISHVAVEQLDGDLLHDSAETLMHYLEKQNRYTSLAAQRLHQTGKKAGALHLLLSPLLRFFKFYVLRLGFLDGLPGLVHICIGCINSFSKYAKLLELNRMRKST
jgi:glycosyltransferase involved in cell wall biosynthesis